MPRESTESFNRNVKLLEMFYKSLWNKDHAAIANCYHQDATFTDIAFKLYGKNKIHAMWHMICETDLRLSYRVENADDAMGLPAGWPITRSMTMVQSERYATS